MSGARQERRAVVVSTSAYERLLAAYPKRFRDLYGEEMVDVFEDECHECLEQAQNGDRLGLMWFWCRSIVDLLGNAILERKRWVMGFSVVRWSGMLAAAGGMTLAASGLWISWLLTNLTLSYAWYVASIGQIVGMLLLAISLMGLVALVARNSDSRTPSRRQVRISSIYRFTRTQWSAVAGILLVALEILSTLGLLAVFTLYEVVGIGGSDRLYPGDLENFLYPALGAMVTFGLPLALILLGAAVWRSNTLGHLSLLPLGVGFATFLVYVATLIATRLLSGGTLSSPNSFEAFATIGLPALVIGVMWTLLGLTVVRGEPDRALA